MGCSEGKQTAARGARRASSVLLDNWQISTFTTFASGTPEGIGYTTSDNADITGGAGDGARMIYPWRDRSFGERTFDRWFDTKVFARPPKGNAGNAPKDVFRGPGTNNWDCLCSRISRFARKKDAATTG